MSEKVYVESIEEEDKFSFGILAYKIITDYVLSDLNIGQAIQKIRILIDIKKPLFVVSVDVNPTTLQIKVKDCAYLKEESDGIHIIIHDESYSADLLRALWNFLGKDRINQLDRWEVVIPKLIKKGELEEIKIVDLKEKIIDKVLDAVSRIIPEGFRINSTLSLKDNNLTVIASENPIQEDWIRIVKEALNKPPKLIPPEKLKEAKREPKLTVEELPKPWKKTVTI